MSLDPFPHSGLVKGRATPDYLHTRQPVYIIVLLTVESETYQSEGENSRCSFFLLLDQYPGYLLIYRDIFSATAGPS